MGFSSITGQETIMFADNASFDGTERTGKLSANSQIWIGSTAVNAGGTHINVGTITSPLGTIDIGYSSPNITIDVTGVTPPGSTLKLNVDAATAPGTNPTLPSGTGFITLEGGTLYATGTRANPIRTNSLAANTIDIEIQYAGDNPAVSTANNFGVCQFDANQFTVTTGFVQLQGGGTAPALTKLGMDTGTSPVVPDSTGLITLTAGVVAAGTNPIRTNGTAANTSKIEVQRSQAIASADATKIGLSNFDNTIFTVDANGFVSLVGGGVPPAQKFNVDANTAPGTDPVLPTAGGVVTITGAQVATGTIGANVIRTNSLAANAFTIEVQRSTAVAATDSTKNGVSHFDSAGFTVDASGFVSLVGGGSATIGLNVDANTAPGTDPVVPNGSGIIALTGAQVAAGTIGANVIRTDSLAANSCTIEIQRSTSNATTDSSKNGVAHFKSTDFSVDGNGFVSLVSPGGLMVQQVRTQDTTSVSTTKTIAPTGTTPTTANSDLLISLTMTPSNSNSVLVFDFNSVISSSNAGHTSFGLFLFEGSTYRTGFIYSTDDDRLVETPNFTYYRTAGTTSSTTFSVYFARTSTLTGTLRTLQSGGGVALLGGAGNTCTSFTITEFTS